MRLEQKAGLKIPREHRPKFALIGIEGAMHQMSVATPGAIGIFMSQVVVESNDPKRLEIFDEIVQGRSCIVGGGGELDHRVAIVAHTRGRAVSNKSTSAAAAPRRAAKRARSWLRTRCQVGSDVSSEPGWATPTDTPLPVTTTSRRYATASHRR